MFVAIKIICKMLQHNWLTRFWIYQVYWIFQGSEYASGSEDPTVTQGSEYVWVCLKNSWVTLNMPEYAWLSDCARIPFNIPHCTLVALFYMLPFSSLVFLNEWLLILAKFIV